MQNEFIGIFWNPLNSWDFINSIICHCIFLWKILIFSKICDATVLCCFFAWRWKMSLFHLIWKTTLVAQDISRCVFYVNLIPQYQNNTESTSTGYHWMFEFLDIIFNLLSFFSLFRKNEKKWNVGVDIAEISVRTPLLPPKSISFNRPI